MTHLSLDNIKEISKLLSDKLAYAEAAGYAEPSMYVSFTSSGPVLCTLSSAGSTVRTYKYCAGTGLTKAVAGWAKA